MQNCELTCFTDVWGVEVESRKHGKPMGSCVLTQRPKLFIAWDYSAAMMVHGCASFHAYSDDFRIYKLISKINNAIAIRCMTNSSQQGEFFIWHIPAAFSLTILLSFD